jgi:isopentenyl diphosphate isomerase/L-lactate dehydrogenase-like FMN-dependent dehydrogenase
MAAEKPISGYEQSTTARREFLRWLAGSALFGTLLPACRSTREQHRELVADVTSALDVFEIEAAAHERLRPDAYEYLAGGADDMRTVQANTEGYRRLQLRVRRLVDVRNIDTKLTILGDDLASPILLAPVGFQMAFHPEGERATARGAASRKRRMIVSSASNYAVGEIVEAGVTPVWFQLYPTTRREVTESLLRRAESAGCRVLVLTVDTPVMGNREKGSRVLEELKRTRMGNFEGLLAPGEPFTDPTLTWDFVAWLRTHCSMKIVLTGIVTKEDAALALRHGADGIIVSNHGGRQEESNRATIESLPEVVEAVGRRIPVLIDGGIRRGTDAFKALALGADAICIGRPYCWGLAAEGQAGVEKVLDLLQAELIRTMQLAGTTSLSQITRSFVV